MTDKSAASIKAERAARPAIELAQDGAELSPKNPCDLSHAHLRLGIDVGSTTVKLAVIDDNDHLVYANYERHHTDVRATAKELFARAQRVIGDTPMRVSITGSGGMLLAKWLDLEFVQEVIASKRAVETLIPQTDCAIELGGEDAKIIYFDNGIEQRMNGTCAGGTGAFIDQMASLLHTDASGLNELRQGRHADPPHRLPLRRLRQDRRPAAAQRGRRPSRTWPPPSSRPWSTRPSPALPAATPSAATWPSSAARCSTCSELRHRFYVTLEPGRGAHHRPGERPPLRGHRRRPCR